MSNAKRITIVVTVRDRYSRLRECLENLYENTPEPFDLVYVTGRPPNRERVWLNEEATKRGFLHIEAGRHMTPPESRNVGLSHARTDYIAFVENDVVFEKGWLSALVACADETGADAVAPLTCEGRPIHTIVHHVGPVETNQDIFEGAPIGDRDFEEDVFLQGNTREQIAPMLVRRKTRWVEMHCFLARRSVFDRIGPFHPDIVSKEFLDFSWGIVTTGGDIWVEPNAVVTFLVPSKADPVTVSDLPYFLLRWSRSWQKRSHDALKTKWGFKEAGYIASRRALADWRIVDHVLKPTVESVPMLGRRWGFVTRAANMLGAPVMAVAAFFAWQYDRARHRAEAYASH